MRTALHAKRIRRVPRRLTARYHPPHQCTHAVHVRPRPKLARVRHLFQCRISLRIWSKRLAVLGNDLLRRSKVDKHWLLVAPPNQDVRWLDIPVQDTRFMHHGQPPHQRHHHCT